MKDLIALLLMQAPALACVIFAGILAREGRVAWVTFLVVAVLLKVSKIKID